MKCDASSFCRIGADSSISKISKLLLISLYSSTNPYPIFSSSTNNFHFYTHIWYSFHFLCLLIFIPNSQVAVACLSYSHINRKFILIGSLGLHLSATLGGDPNQRSKVSEEDTLSENFRIARNVWKNSKNLNILD